jgi:cytochrome c biogenesis protein CcdA/thiol-disulfide isomerase/thioredoxin
MIALVGIAFVAGMVTAISPCVLPVLPIVFAGSATGERRRPFAVIAGLVASFTTFTLAAAALLSALGLPDDLLRNIAIGVVLAMGLGLLIPQIGHLLERPFRALGRRLPGDVGGGFLLGVSLGLLFTPCAGPIIAAVATVAATERFTASAVFVTLAYALGAGLVLLGLALLARRGLSLTPLKQRAPFVRRVLGATIVAAAIVMALGLDTRLATKVPGYTQALQGLEESATAATRISDLVGSTEPAVAEESSELDDYGEAPEFSGISDWFNSKPLTLAGLRGKVVLVDFWTYSCVNCLRTLPFLREWHETYARNGLVVVGVHTPEFAFERDPENVQAALEDLDVTWPVALDPDYGTWNAWGNRYWPAEYFIDKRGHVRFAHFGEGAYEEKEQVIRELLAEPGLPPPVSARIEDQTPTEPQTPETYLGYLRLDRIVGSPVHADTEAAYEFPEYLPPSSYALEGQWRVGAESAVAGESARLRLNYHGRRVFLVLGSPDGRGTVEISHDGMPAKTVRVTEHRLYELASTPGPAADHVLELALSPGVEAYAFTFG